MAELDVISDGTNSANIDVTFVSHVLSEVAIFRIRDFKKLTKTRLFLEFVGLVCINSKTV